MSSQDCPPIVFMREDGWFFRDQGGDDHGPFATHEEAHAARRFYCVVSSIAGGDEGRPASDALGSSAGHPFARWTGAGWEFAQRSRDDDLKGEPSG